MVRLGVNIDHVATVRQARRTYEPDPVWAAPLAILGGADGITMHLREDRRHIQDRDLALMRQVVPTKLNLEMAVAEPIVRIALKTRPDQATLVPEKREEITTEGGLNVTGNFDRVRNTVKRLRRKGIEVSLFIDPDAKEIEASARAGAQAVELHTGNYANATLARPRARALKALIEGAQLAAKLGLAVYAGHGLTYQNVEPVAKIPQVEELNIGHSIIARAIFVGLKSAVREMKEILLRAGE